MLVALTCTRDDFFRFERTIFQSLENFRACFGSAVFFLIVFQDKSLEDFDFSVTFLERFPEDSYLFKKVNYLSVSRARNDAIQYASNNGFDSIIFHDVSLVYGAAYLDWVKSKSHCMLLSGGYIFSDSLDSLDSSGSEGEVYFKDFDDIYLWSYVFPLSADFPFFDERFGPGESSIFTSGEDFIFLRRFFQLNPDMRYFVRFLGTGILHPSRPKNYSKHLAYAEGQGKIHQIYLLEEKSLYAVWRCVLFFGNALLRVLLLRKSSLRIIFLRIKGFFDYKIKV